MIFPSIIRALLFLLGLPDAPFNGSVDIILQDRHSITIELPNYFPLIESRVIAVLGGLDLHGSLRDISWTRIATTAVSGETLIILSEPVNWMIGDEFVITTTDRDISHTERHRIASIDNGTIIHTMVPLAYTHIVLRHTFPNGQTVNIAAAVGLLTHNVRVINQSPSPNLSGFRIFITQYSTSIWYSDTNQLVNTYYKGYARLSNTQFIGFAQFDDTTNSDQRSCIYMNNLNDWNSQRPTSIDACSFDGGFNAAIGMLNTNGVRITNNVIYNTYRTGIAVTGRNNIVRNNLVTTVYWSGTAQSSSIAEYNINYDGAIMSRDAVSVIMQNNLVSGVERSAYRIQGEACPSAYIPRYIYNDYSNNEAHSAMSGVSLWPLDKGFSYDRKCVIIKGFTIYKAWYYGFYINTPRNITIDSCKSIDSRVGIFTYIVGPSPLTRIIIQSRVNIQNSMVIGSITPNDCSDVINSNSNNIQFAQMAIPTVSGILANNGDGDRSGIVFPTISTYNGMPIRSWNRIGNYPCLDGSMLIRNTILAFFNDICNRHDIAIQVSQSNDDGQFPITTSLMFVYNTSETNQIFNGQPNLDAVNPRQCGDMDCDGLKKNLVIDIDGTLFGQPSGIFSQAESLWGKLSMLLLPQHVMTYLSAGNQQHGIGDFRIPMVAMTNLSGNRINISSIYPYRGISRTNSCILHSSWGMYQCNYDADYRMLIIESMDSDTETRRLSPVAIMSNNGYIDLINGPSNHLVCNGYACRRRISTFMAIVKSGQVYQIYLTSTPPKRTRFRLINADSTIKCILALYYNSLQQIDVYANTVYTSPINRDPNSTVLKLLDQPNNITFSSPPGANYFDRTYQLAYFVIDGNTMIELRMSPLLILNFGLPPMDPAMFYTGNIRANLAALFNISPDKIRRVSIISASSQTRLRRQVSSIRLNIELRDEPRTSSTSTGGVLGELLSNIAASIINRYQTGQLQTAWKALNLTGDIIPVSLDAQEPFDNVSTPLGIINRTALLIPPASCRQQSPCTIQPAIVAYDAEGNVIQKLGTNDQPWQVQGTVIGQSSQIVYGGIANYSNGRAQFQSFSLPNLGSYQIQFTFIQPNGINSSFFTTANLTVQTDSVTVTEAILGGQQVSNIYVVNVNDTFDISVVPVDNITGLQLGQIKWDNWTWWTNVTLYNLPSFNSHGSLIAQNTSTTIVNLTAGSVIALFQVSALPTIISQAVTTLIKKFNAVPGLSLTSVSINGRSYSVSSSPDSSSGISSDNQEANIGLIVGLVVGLVSGALKQNMFPVALLVFQCIFIILYGVHADYGLKKDETTNITEAMSHNSPPPEGDVEFYYSFFQDVHVMMFIGFGFLMTFLRRYSFSSVSFNFLIAAFVVEWAILVHGYIFEWNTITKSFPVNVNTLLHADFVCASVLISFGAVLGKTNPAQLIVLALIEVVIQVWNEYIGVVLFCIYDAGESIYVHVFGAYFGLATSFTLQHRRTIESEKESSSYASDIFSMIGTLFLFCFWPSFNAGVAYGDGRLRAIVNTYVSISASVILTFTVSALVGKGKKEIIHIQNATLAGGVAIGTVADKNIGLFGAMIIGSLAGTISTLGYKYLLELLKKFRIHDTCGVHNLHGMPGVLAGLAGIVVASMPSKSFYHENLTHKCLSGGEHRTVSVQAGYQCAGLLLTLGMAIIGGLLTGILLRLPIFSTPNNDSYFDDSLNWHVPQDFVAEDSALGNLIKNFLPNEMQLEEKSKQDTPTIEKYNPNTIEFIQEKLPQQSIQTISGHSNQSASLY
ncbi:unnamed protein product [Rotaria sordida]|uniref:G8 domain-containing protein n=1 Tax=Rotaria sordida TaxID=392033 RepID=A0A814EG99_9BILA|nr:unnamed protein product [Rotaria sordida]